VAKFVFRLQDFLRLRERLEEQKKQEYGLAVAKLEREKQLLAALRREKDGNIDSFRNQIQIKIEPQRFRIHNDYIEWLKVRIVEQEKVVVIAQNFVHEKRRELIEAMKNRKVLEKLREKELAVFFREQNLAERRVVDEIVSYRYQASQA